MARVLLRSPEDEDGPTTIEELRVRLAWGTSQDEVRESGGRFMCDRLSPRGPLGVPEESHVLGIEESPAELLDDLERNVQASDDPRDGRLPRVATGALRAGGFTDERDERPECERP